jgi:hypothetical protein
LQSAFWLATPHARSVPTSPANRSRTRSVQVPRLLLPSKRASWSCCGRKLPVNGAAPSEMLLTASSSNVVPEKFWPA